MGRIETLKGLLDGYGVKNEIISTPDETAVLSFEVKGKNQLWCINVTQFEDGGLCLHTTILKVCKNLKYEIYKALNDYNKKYNFAKTYYQESEKGEVICASYRVPALEYLELTYVFDSALKAFVCDLDCIMDEIPVSKFKGVEKQWLFSDGKAILKTDTITGVTETGNVIKAKTHADFLNILLHKSYDGYGKCVYSFNDRDVIWMIRLDNKPTATGWCNSLSADGEKITESYIGAPIDRLDSHKAPAFHQRRYVFDIVETTTREREYIFKGVFEFSKEEGNNDCRIWKKCANSADFDEIQKASAT